MNVQISFWHFTCYIDCIPIPGIFDLAATVASAAKWMHPAGPGTVWCECRCPLYLRNMPALNYILHTEFEGKFQYGQPVHSVFLRREGWLWSKCIPPKNRGRSQLPEVWKRTERCVVDTQAVRQLWPRLLASQLYSYQWVLKALRHGWKALKCLLSKSCNFHRIPAVWQSFEKSNEIKAWEIEPLQWPVTRIKPIMAVAFSGFKMVSFPQIWKWGGMSTKVCDWQTSVFKLVHSTTEGFLTDKKGLTHAERCDAFASFTTRYSHSRQSFTFTTVATQVRQMLISSMYRAFPQEVFYIAYTSWCADSNKATTCRCSFLKHPTLAIWHLCEFKSSVIATSCWKTVMSDLEGLLEASEEEVD